MVGTIVAIRGEGRQWVQGGRLLRTSLLHQFSDGFHFKTLNSTYLLLGPGSRKPASADTIACLIKAMV